MNSCVTFTVVELNVVCSVLLLFLEVVDVFVVSEMFSVVTLDVNVEFSKLFSVV